MKSYDTFDHDNKLHIFPVPVFKNRQVEFSGGQLRHYEIGQEVPWKTWWYNYGPEFTVVDWSPEETLIYVFSEGRFMDCLKYSLANVDKCKYAFGLSRNVYDGYGNKLRIVSRNDLIGYVIARGDLARLKNRISNIRRKIFGAGADLDELCMLCLENSVQVKNADNYFYVYKPDELMSYYGAYLYLAQEIASDEFFKTAKDIINMFTIDDFFKWNETAVIDMPAIVRADRKIRGWEEVVR